MEINEKKMKVIIIFLVLVGVLLDGGNGAAIESTESDLLVVASTTESINNDVEDEVTTTAKPITVTKSAPRYTVIQRRKGSGGDSNIPSTAEVASETPKTVVSSRQRQRGRVTASATQRTTTESSEESSNNESKSKSSEETETSSRNHGQPRIVAQQRQRSELPKSTTTTTRQTTTTTTTTTELPEIDSPLDDNQETEIVEEDEPAEQIPVRKPTAKFVEKRPTENRKQNQKVTKEYKSPKSNADRGKSTFHNTINSYSNGPDDYSFSFKTADGHNRDEAVHIDRSPKSDDDDEQNQKNISAKGSYSFISADGFEYTVTYTADSKGYRPKVNVRKL